MEIHNTIKKIMFLPRVYHERGDISEYDLLKESGYFELYNEISVDNIYKMLHKYSECADDWIQYSEDQRCSPTWYIVKEKKNKYLVGYLSRNHEHEKVEEYKDKFKACAHFIKHIIEQIRGIKKGFVRK